jgi:hypothetical protein
MSSQVCSIISDKRREGPEAKENFSKNLITGGKT